MALAMALALTTVTVFGLFALGLRGGLFGRPDTGEKTVSAEPQHDVVAALQYLAAIGAQQTPDVVTEYIYVDAPADPPQVTYVTRAGAPGAASRPQVVATPSTAVPVAEPTEQEVESPTPALPPPTVPPSPPPASGDDGRGGDGEDGPSPSEDEFEAVVSAINGDVVTFEHRGELVEARVTDSSDLSVGMEVKVHLIRVGDDWVAKEIEISD
jgi:hypothetical protein